MTPHPISNRIAANGTYQLEDTIAAPGTEVAFEVEGAFGTGTATIGYADSAGAFVPFAAADPLTAAGGFRVTVPASGVLALKLEGATAPAILAKITRTKA